MIGAIGGLTVAAMLLSYRLDRRLVPIMWTVAIVAMIASAGGVL